MIILAGNIGEPNPANGVGVFDCSAQRFGDYHMALSADPQGYASPELLMEDKSLSVSDRKARLEQWKLDIELQLNATDENMPSMDGKGDAKPGVDSDKSEMLRRIHDCLRRVEWAA